MSTWKRDFASGLVVVTPLLVILFVANWLYNLLATLPFVPTITPPEGGVFAPGSRLAPLNEYAAPLYGFAEVLVALVVFVLLVFSAGYLMRTTSGRLAEGVIDNAINRVPGLRVIYNASKLAVETALTGTDDLQTPVKLEPWNGMRMTAFKTGQTTADGREVVFMPTAPNITTGFVMEVDPDDIEEVDEKVEEALTRILSAGFGEGGNRSPAEAAAAGVAEPGTPGARGGDSTSDADRDTDANRDTDAGDADRDDDRSAT
ncbi:DUF502 domain-containing protein [Halobaculum sp. CBA1158]|uniref:DUF502 domain-containing protein n=1 Tax=Halobaculum sp. CBA1158 TaxID=2904243 RepID=UPI001F23EBB8|nr:DUF502 domain-containing protein [Halobaculum sp. CBA1158]UIP00729.1 DUF502 domain-containing protein [Halobaculum sp. CBA1158]